VLYDGFLEIGQAECIRHITFRDFSRKAGGSLIEKSVSKPAQNVKKPILKIKACKYLFTF
jgi:hypothetical protein